MVSTEDTGSTEEPTITELVVASDDFEILEAAVLRASDVPIGGTPMAKPEFGANGD